MVIWVIVRVILGISGLLFLALAVGPAREFFKMVREDKRWPHTVSEKHSFTEYVAQISFFWLFLALAGLTLCISLYSLFS